MSKKITIRLPEETYQGLELAAKLTGLTKSAIARSALQRSIYLRSTFKQRKKNDIM